MHVLILITYHIATVATTKQCIIAEICEEFINCSLYLVNHNLMLYKHIK